MIQTCHPDINAQERSLAHWLLAHVLLKRLQQLPDIHHLAANVGSANEMGANSAALTGWRFHLKCWIRTVLFLAWIVLNVEKHQLTTQPRSIVMRKSWRRIFGTAALAFMLCLTGLVMSGEAQAQRFVDNGNGTVTDKKTQLMWAKNTDQFFMMNWFDAEKACSSASVGGISGWRLPTRHELSELVIAIQSENPFTNVRPAHWSSSINPDNDNEAAFVITSSGFAPYSTKTGSEFFVWPVR